MTLYNYDELSRQEQILANIALTGYCTSENIKTLFGYTALSTSVRMMYPCIDKGFIKTEQRRKDLSHGFLYYITAEGYEYIKKKLGEDPYIEKDGKYILNFTNPKKIADIHVPHAVCVNNWYYYITEKVGYGSFKWYGDKEKLFLSQYSQVKLYPDVVVDYNNKQYIIEQDMGTEFSRKVISKIESYAKVIIENTISPNVFIAVNIDSDIQPVANRRVRGSSNLQKEIVHLKSQIDAMQKRMEVFATYQGVPQQILNSSRQQLEAFISQPPVGIPSDIIEAVGAAFTNLCNYLDNSQHFVDAQAISDLQKEYKIKVQALREVKKDVKSTTKIQRIKDRVNFIKDIILSAGVDDILNIFHKGFNLYVGSDQEILSKLCALIDGTETQYTKLLSTLIHMFEDVYPKTEEYQYKSFKNEEVYIYPETFFFPECFSVSQHGSSMYTVAVEDMTCNNIGAYSRLSRLQSCISTTETDRFLIVLIVDNFEQSQQINKSISGKLHVGYIEWQYVKESKDYGDIEDNLYLIDENGVSWKLKLEA